MTRSEIITELTESIALSNNHGVDPTYLVELLDIHENLIDTVVQYEPLTLHDHIGYYVAARLNNSKDEIVASLTNQANSM